MGINGEVGRRGRLVLLLPLRRVIGEDDEEEEELEAEVSAVWILEINSFFFSSSPSCFSSLVFFCTLFWPNFVEFKVAGNTQLQIHPAFQNLLSESKQTQRFKTIHDRYKNEIGFKFNFVLAFYCSGTYIILVIL